MKRFVMEEFYIVTSRITLFNEHFPQVVKIALHALVENAAGHILHMAVPAEVFVFTCFGFVFLLGTYNEFPTM